MSDMFLGSQLPLYQNVYITKRSKTGKILEQRTAKNRVTKLMLFGIGKFLLGHFNDSSPDKIYEFIPRYLALGTNIAGPNSSGDVGKTPSVNDVKLLNEITKASTTEGNSETVKRIWIAERNICKLNTKFSDENMKISIKTYVNDDRYNGQWIGEAGLFSKEKDNNCLARVVFNPILKNKGDVLDIQWDITLHSYGQTIYPEKIEIENGSKITLPLKYTNKKLKTIELGLKYETMNVDGTSTKCLVSTEITDNNKIEDIIYFTLESNGNKKKFYPLYNLEIIKNTKWGKNLLSIGSDFLLKAVYNQICNSSVDSESNPYFMTIGDISSIIHFGNLYTSVNSLNDIDRNEACMTLIINEDTNVKKEDTEWTYKIGDKEGSYSIYSPDNKSNIYKVVQNRFYKINPSDSSKWVETDYFMYNGIIVNINQEKQDYEYSNGHFYKTKDTITESVTNTFVNYGNLKNDKQMYFYNYNESGLVIKTNYFIDYNNYEKIFIYDESETSDDKIKYTNYHISNDDYIVTGEYEKLIPIISPPDATDRSIRWLIQNQDIAKLNWDGVVTAWNIGETTAIVSTTNDLSAKCIIEVVKDVKYIPVDSITIDPEEIILYVDGDENQYVTINAIVEPIFATNTTVNWTIDSNIIGCISAINCGDNKLKVTLNGSGNISFGYITATSQSGKSAKCLVRVIYMGEVCDDDCENTMHLEQKGGKSS